MIATDLVGEVVELSRANEVLVTGTIRAVYSNVNVHFVRFILELDGGRVEVWNWDATDAYSQLEIIRTTFDATAKQLARSVLAGDKVAARALADRVQELCQE